VSRQLGASPNRGFEFQKSRQLFIRMYNVTLSVAAMRVSDPDVRPYSFLFLTLGIQAKARFSGIVNCGAFLCVIKTSGLVALSGITN
jgi:hypothetical protein